MKNGEDRESNLELLRLLSIIGILVLHTSGIIYETATGMNLYIGVVLNSILNIGVTCFMLISGFFGMQFSVKKLIHLELLALFYSFLGIIIRFLLGENISLVELIRCCFPIVSRRFWFLSCYVALLCLSPYVNKFFEILKREEYTSFLLVMLLIFSIVPTFLKYDLMRDNGKGLIGVFLSYAIGRYLRKFDVDLPLKNLIIAFLTLTAINCVVNSLITYIVGGCGIIAPFARDCSILIIMQAVTLFLLIKKIRFKSRVINGMASGVLAVYIGDEVIRSAVVNRINLLKYQQDWKFFILVSIIAMTIFLMCESTELVRKKALGRIENAIGSFAEDIFSKCSERIKQLISD